MSDDDLQNQAAFGGPLVVGGVMLMTTRLKREGYTDSREALAAAIERGWLDTREGGVAINEEKGVTIICEELVDNPKAKRWVKRERDRPWEVDVVATLEAIGEAVLEEHQREKRVNAASNGRWHL